MLLSGPSGGKAGDGGKSYTGFAAGGDGRGDGPGGNAYTGTAGVSDGGNIYNDAEGDRYRDGRGRHSHGKQDPAIFNAGPDSSSTDKFGTSEQTPPAT